MEDIKREIKQIKKLLEDEDTIEPISYPKLSKDYEKIKKETKKGEESVQELASVTAELKELNAKLEKLKESNTTIEEKKKKDYSLKTINTEADKQINTYIHAVNKYMGDHPDINKYYLQTYGTCLDLYNDNTQDVTKLTLEEWKKETDLQKQKQQQKPPNPPRQPGRGPRDSGRGPRDSGRGRGRGAARWSLSYGGGPAIVSQLRGENLDKVIEFFKKKDNFEELKKEIQLIKNVPILYDKDKIKQYIKDLYILNKIFIDKYRTTYSKGEYKNIDFKSIPIPTDDIKLGIYQQILEDAKTSNDFLEIHKYRKLNPFDENWICKEIQVDYAKELYKALMSENLKEAAQLIKPVFLNNTEYTRNLTKLLIMKSFDEDKKLEESKKELDKEIAEKTKKKDELTDKVKDYKILDGLSVERQTEIREQIKGRILDEYHTISGNIQKITTNLSTVSGLLKKEGYLYTSTSTLIKANQEACQAIYWNARSLVSMYTCMFPYTFRPKTQIVSLVDRIYTLFRNSSRKDLTADSITSDLTSDLTSASADTTVEYRREALRKLIKLKREIKQYKDYVNVIDLATYTSNKDTFYKDNIIRIAKEVILNSLFDKKREVTATELKECSAINQYFVSEEYADQILQEHVILMYSIFHKIMYMGTPELVTTILKRNSVTDKMGKINEYIRMYQFLIKSVKIRYARITGTGDSLALTPLYLNKAPLLSKIPENKRKAYFSRSLNDTYNPNTMDVPTINTEYQGLEIKKGGAPTLDQTLDQYIQSNMPTITFPTVPSDNKDYTSLTNNLIQAPFSILQKLQFYYTYCGENEVQPYLELPIAEFSVQLSVPKDSPQNEVDITRLQQMKLHIEETVLASPFKDKSYELFELVWMNIQNYKLMFITEHILQKCLNKLIVACNYSLTDNTELYERTLKLVNTTLDTLTAKNIPESDKSPDNPFILPYTWRIPDKEQPSKTTESVFQGLQTINSINRTPRTLLDAGLNKLKGGAPHSKKRIDAFINAFIKETSNVVSHVIHRPITIEELNDMLIRAENMEVQRTYKYIYKSILVSLLRMYASDYTITQIINGHNIQRIYLKPGESEHIDNDDKIYIKAVYSLLTLRTDAHDYDEKYDTLSIAVFVGEDKYLIKIKFFCIYLIFMKYMKHTNKNMIKIQYNFIKALNNLYFRTGEANRSTVKDPEYKLIIACNEIGKSNVDKAALFLANMSISKMIIANTLARLDKNGADIPTAVKIIQLYNPFSTITGNNGNITDILHTKITFEFAIIVPLSRVPEDNVTPVE